MPKPTGSTAKERIMARASAMGEVSTSGGMTMETAAPTVQKTVGKRERQVVSPGGTFLGGFSYTKPKTRQKTAKELADEQAQYQLSEQEYQRLLGLELDKYRTEVEQAKKKAQESKSPYNIHAFGGYDPNRKTLDERTYEAMLADLNKAESLQYDVKGREALDKLTEEQNAALELLNTERSDTAKRQTAWQTMQQGGYSDEEISQLVNYYRNIPKRERNAEWYAFAQNWAKQQADSDPVGSTIKSIPANLLSGLGTIDAAMRKLSDPNTPTDYNAPAMLPYAYASGMRGEVTKNLQYDHGDTAAFLYGVGTSVLDSGATAALALLGVPPVAASATLGGAAATDAMVAAKDRGLDDTHAIRTGVAAGILESFLEKFSLESLIHMKLPTGTAGQKLAGMLKNTAVQAGIEGSEEMFTDIGNLIADKWINGGMADVEQRIYVYMAGGMSYAEAQQKVANETIKDIALDFGAGFLAGGIMGGGNMAVQTAAQRSGRLTVEQYQQFLRDAGMEQDIPESTANTALEEAAEKYGADAEAFRRTYTEGQDTALYDSAYQIAYEYGKVGAKEDAVMQQDSLSYLSEAQRRIAYTVGRDAAAWQSSLGEHGSAAWTEALKSDVENKGRLKAGFTVLYQAGLRRESAVNVKSAAASALPQSVQTAAYQAGLSDAAASLAREKAGLDFVSSAGSESGLVDNEHARKMAKEQAGTAALLNTLGKNLGVRIEMVDTISGGKANGVYIAGKNLIRIAADANNAVEYVAAHEVTHRMQELAPEEYRAYRDHAMSYRSKALGEETTAGIVAEYIAKAEDAGVKLTQEEAMDEIAANFTEDMMKNGKLFENFAKENRSAAKKLLDALKAFIAKVKSCFSSKAAQDRAAQDAYGKSMAELEQCVALWQKAYDAAGKQAQKAKTATREGDGEGRYQIKNIDGRLMTVIDTQNDTRDFKAAEAYLKTLVNSDHPFSTILMDAQPVFVGKDLPGEYKSSEYTKTMKPALRKIKMQAATNLDEMLLLAENGEWRENVKPKHAKDAQNGWYRYDTEFVVPVLDAKKTVDHYTVYGGTLLIRNDADGKSYLYDLLDVEKKKVISKTSFSAETHSEVTSPKPSTASISTSDEKVNGKFSLKAYSDAEKKQHVTDAKAFFGRTYKWAETGYITTDGARLDFSGKHEGGPGGYRTVDHRDIRDALGDDYGGDDYSGAMVQFMGDGNIRISPESGGINLSVMPTKAQMDTLSDFISKERGEVVLDLDDTNGVTLSSTEYPRGTHSNKVLNDIKAFFETGAAPQVSELGKFRYQLKSATELEREVRELTKYAAYRQRGTTDREVLLSAADGSVKTEWERKRLAEYKDAVGRLEGYETRLSANRAKLTELSLADGKKNAKRISYLRDEITKDTNRVAIVENKLQDLENNRSLQELLGRERATIQQQERTYLGKVEELLGGYRDLYGTMREGEKPARDIQLPKKSSENEKISQTVRTVLEAKATPEEMVPNIETLAMEGKYSYETYSDKAAIADADGEIQRVGWAQALTDWKAAMKSGNVSKKNTAMGWALYNNAANSGDTETALNVLSDMVQHQRSAAQALQATRILKQLSPETQLYQAQRSIESLQTELNKEYGDNKAPGLKIDPKLAEQFMKAADQAERDAVLTNIYRDIGKQMPSRFRDKWNAWRYLSMLGNARTHVRNVVGNAGFVPVVAAKDAVATGIEKAVYRLSGGKMQRSKEFVTGKGGKALLQAAAQDYAKVADVAMGGGKYSDLANANKYIEEGRVIFRIKPLEVARKANSKALDAEDAWFSKPHYAYAMAQYCKANGITAEMIAKGGDKVERAREYAIREAQKATYRDTNAFSQAISELGRMGRNSKNGAKRTISTVMEGILPFRKTPANILARGVEYSPIGLLNGFKQAIFDVQKGTKTAAEAIDAISAGLTGTGLLALGLFWAAQGLVRGHGDDDDKKNDFMELAGHQAYALELPNGTSITLDWLAPECLPFFVGVNLWELTDGGEEPATMADWLTAISQVSEPMLEMSCLQSLNDVFDSVGYASSNGLAALPTALANAATSYVAQGIPTILGQAERTGEGLRYTTFTSKNSKLTGDMQYALGRASAKIPIWDYSQIPYIDAWGRTESTGDVGTRAFNNFLNPAYTSTVDMSAMEQELLRLYEDTGESVLPQRAKKYFNVDKKRVDLTGEQYVTYAQKKGSEAYKWLTELTQNAAYRSMSDEEKADCIARIYSAANEVAKAEVVSSYEPTKWVKEALKGGGVVNAAIAKTREK